MTNLTAARRARLQSIVATQVRPAAGDALAMRNPVAWTIREPEGGRRYTVLRIETRGGLRGYGECAEMSEREFQVIKQAIEGQPATAYEAVWNRLAPAPRMRAAVNMAQIDIAGKACKAPAFQLLGGPTRNKARALAVLEGPAALERAQNAGFRAFAVRAPENEWRNAGKAYVQRVGTLMQRMRRATGPDSDFVLDGEGRLVPGDAQSVAAELEPFHLLWFDEPCRVANLGAIRKIAGENVTPLGFGRTVTEPGEFQDLLREDCADILRPDIGVHGISQIRRIAALAEIYYVAVAPFHDGGPIATAAALHLAASIPNFFIQQIPFPAGDKDRLLRRDLAGAGLEQVAQGFAALPTGPGLGIEVNEKVFAR